VEVELDKQGRIRIPDRLREAAHLESAVVLIGAVDRIELWSPEGFQEQVESGGSEFAQFAPRIFG
jgi:MraZ protein